MSFTCKHPGCPDYGFTFRYPGTVFEVGKGRRFLTPAEDAAQHHATMHANLARRTISRQPLVNTPEPSTIG